MKQTMNKIEFNKIKEMLSNFASADKVKEKCMELTIELNEVRCKSAMLETTEARKLLDSIGLPPISNMQGLQGILDHMIDGYCLSEEQLSNISTFLASSSRMKQYLKRAEYLSLSISGYGYSLNTCNELRDEIDACIRNHRVEDNASPELKKIRHSIEDIKEKVKSKLEQMLRSKSQCFVDSYVSQRNGHYVLPVKKEYKSQIDGVVYDQSSTGNTIYVEPSVVGMLQKEILELEIAEENEVKRILYTLTAMVFDHLDEIKGNMVIMCDLDFVFAKGKLSQAMKAIAVPITTDLSIKIVNGRHPLLPEEVCVPLNFYIGEDTRGIIITGPNTGGKTVALKTVGLLSMMAQSGLHVPVMEGSSFCMNNCILCDMGDGQSIEQNLSTFSSHINRIIEILKNISSESLVLLDEVGSGTDPAEGMGIAISILEELKNIGCLFVATTHYPEVKEYAMSSKSLINARMEFDKETLQPLYQLKIGEAGESCALYIAKRLGFPQHMIETAYNATYGDDSVEMTDSEVLKRDTERKSTKDTTVNATKESTSSVNKAAKESINEGRKEIANNTTKDSINGATKEYENNTTRDSTVEATKDRSKNSSNDKGNEIRYQKNNVARITKERGNKKVNNHALSFDIGDSVVVYPEKKIGIVCEKTNEQGEVMVQIQKKKKWINHKRLKIKAKAADMYPADYDFSIIFDTVENRKARHKMGKRHDPNVIIRYSKEES